MEGECATSERKAGCPCGQCPCQDPVGCGTKLWAAAFFKAMNEVQVDILKAKIQKAWGPMMDKAADAALETAGTAWQASLAQAKAKEDFRDKLEKLWQSGK